MSNPQKSQAEDGKLVITLNSSSLPVSYVSSMLRVLQAAVRDVARGVDDAHDLLRVSRSPCCCYRRMLTALI